MSATLEIKYDGDKEKLKFEGALGNYIFVGLTKLGSPVYVQHDDDYEKGKQFDSNPGGRSTIIRDWENDENWIGTVNKICQNN